MVCYYLLLKLRNSFLIVYTFTVEGEDVNYSSYQDLDVSKACD